MALSALGLDPLSLLLGLIVFVVLWKFTQKENGVKIPGPKPYPIFGNIVEMLEPREKVVENSMKRRAQFGRIICFWAGSRQVVIITDPEYIETVIKSSKHSEKASSYNFLQPWLGRGLLTSYGKQWMTHRKLITPTFHFKVLQSFIGVFHENANILANKLDAKAKTAEEFDLYSLITLCTLDIICETAMGTKVNAQKESHNQYVQSVYRLSELILYRITHIWLYPSFIFERSSTGKEFRKHLDVVHEFSNSVIRSKKEAQKEKKTSTAEEDDEFERKKMSFLDLLLESSMENGTSLLTDEELREEVDTFMFEGHDTTSAGLVWTLSLLAEHPNIQEECYEELRTLFQDDPNRVPTVTDLAEMKLLERVIKESLRMYPSVFSIGRVIEEDVEFGKYKVPKGTDIMIGIHLMHRDPEYYPNPNKFDPDRFLPENSLKRHPYAYLPFSAGPRNCIGQKFALYEEKIVLCTLIRNFKFHSTKPSEEISKIPDIVLKPKSGVMMKISRR